MPGEESHFLMEPEMRRKWRDISLVKEKKPRKAAVMALFYPKHHDTYILLILRKSYEGVHSNQIGFPGGKKEKYDKNMMHTALRETEEEVGVISTSVEIIRPITPLYIPPSNFWVNPFMGIYEKPKPFVIQESEVAAVIEVPLKHVFDETNLIRQTLSTSYAKNIEVPAFEFQGHIVWGATAMMLNEIKALFNQLL